MHIGIGLIPVKRPLGIEEHPIEQGESELHREDDLEQEVHSPTQRGLEGEEVDGDETPLGQQGQEETPVCEVPEVGLPSCVGCIEYGANRINECYDQPN